MQKPRQKLEELCFLKLDKISFKSRACRERAEELVPIYLKKAIRDAHTDYSVLATAKGVVPVSEEFYEFKVVEKREWATEIVTATVAWSIEKSAEEYALRPRFAALRALMKLIREEAHAHLKRIISALFVAASAGTAYTLNKLGIVDLVGIWEKVAAAVSGIAG